MLLVCMYNTIKTNLKEVLHLTIHILNKLKEGKRMVGTYYRQLKADKENWNNLPNLLTIIRLIGSFALGLYLLLWSNSDMKPIYSAVFFVILALTDTFDGIIARARNQLTEFGQLLDPIVDSIFGFCMLLPLCFDSSLARTLTFFILLRQLHIMWLSYWVGKKGVTIETLVSGKFKTWAQGFAILALLLSQNGTPGLIATLLVILAIAATLYSWNDYYKKYSKC